MTSCIKKAGGSDNTWHFRPPISSLSPIIALSGEGRLRLGIAGANSALRSACTALPR
ncbi:MAG: hypothetical protein II886_07865 [Prevotella sp.]|nr:hypothetical protein [Prevotella sp.]